MIIELKKFGEDLHGRPSGKDAYDSIIARLNDLPKTEHIIIDFGGVNSFYLLARRGFNSATKDIWESSYS